MKIKSIEFKNHKILGDLKLDFTLEDERVADTIIFAGENGTGKNMPPYLVVYMWKRVA